MTQNSRQPERLRLVVADSVRDMGGAERFVLDLAHHLPARGWEVTVLAYPGAPLHRRCAEMGLPVHTARTRANGAPWTVLSLLGWLRRSRPDLILTEYDKDLRTLGLASRIGLPGTRIIHSRECDGPIKDRPWIRAYHTRVADRLLVASEATRESTTASAPWLDSGRVHVVAKGIDARQFEGVPPVQDGPLRLGFLGQLVPRKRVDILLHELRRSGVNASLRIAGAGVAESALKALALELGLGDRVRFDGYVRDLPGWFSRIDALVLPSLEEGWGYVLAEAAAAGRMVLAYRSSSVAEVTPEDAGALLVDPSTEDLGAGLRRLAALPPAELRRRGSTLQEHARRRLGLDRMLDELDTLFRETVALPR